MTSLDGSSQKAFLSYLGIASSLPACFVYLVHSLIGKRFSVHAKALFSLVGMIITFTGFIVLAYLDTSDWTDAFMVVNLVLAVIVNVFRAIFRITNRCGGETTSVTSRKQTMLLFTSFCFSSYLGRFPVTYIGNLSNGICMAGLIAVSINIAILGMDVDMQVIKLHPSTSVLIS